MASTTPNLGLLKKDPATDGNDTFNIKTMLNDNWDKIDAITPSKIGAETPAGATSKANAAVSAHVAAADPHPQYATDTDLSNHIADYIRQPGYAVATGAANTYAVTLNPAPTAYVDGMAVAVKINVANTGASTININGLGAKSIKKANGNAVSSGNLKVGSIYTLRYNGTDFILQGEGGGGTAQPADVLSGQTFTNDAGDQTGTMVNRGAVTITPGTTDQTIPAGFHNGSGVVKAATGNVKSVQRGTTLLSGSTNFIDVTITSVDTTKSIALISARQNTSGSPNRTAVRVTIRNSTTIRLETLSTVGPYDVEIEWQVVEFVGVKSIQSGTGSGATSEITFTISPVDLNKSIIFSSHATNSTSSNDPLIIQCQLVNSTTVRYRQRSDFTATLYVNWFVVEFY